MGTFVVHIFAAWVCMDQSTSVILTNYGVERQKNECALFTAQLKQRKAEKENEIRYISCFSIFIV